MIDIPDELIATQYAYNGAAGRAFVAALPGLAGRFLEEWGLRRDGAAMYGMCALVLPVVREADGVPAALKLQLVDEETVGEPVALRAWGAAGAGAVGVLGHDRGERGDAAGPRQVVPGRFDGPGAAVGEGLAAPGGALPPAGEAEVEEFLGAGGPLRPARVGADRELALEQLLPGRGETGVLGGEPLQPPGRVQVRHDERVAAPGAHGQVHEDGAAALPGEGRVVEEGAGGVEGGGDDDRSGTGQLAERTGVDAGGRLDGDPDGAGVAGQPLDEPASRRPGSGPPAGAR
ncbi:hypothetical protein SMICM304S_02236 [Streptomyces microflavus]